MSNASLTGWSTSSGSASRLPVRSASAAGRPAWSGSSASGSRTRSRSSSSERPSVYAIRHEGAFEGTGVFDLEALDGGRTRLTWDETLVAPVLPNLVGLILAPILGRVFQADLERLKEQLEIELRSPWAAEVELHLVDATYELFRAHFAPRPPVLGRDGRPLSGVAGLVEQLLYLLREEGATHVGCATDRVIASFRNDLLRRLQDGCRDAARAARASSRSRNGRSRRSA